MPPHPVVRRTCKQARSPLVVGILTMPHAKKAPGNAHIMSAYVDWFEERGVRVLPIPYDTKHVDTLFGQIHGLLIPGGETDVVLRNKIFMRTVRRFMECALSSQSYFPVWGTCFGMEALLAVLGGIRTFHEFPMHGITPITLTEEGKRSRMFHRMSRKTLQFMENEPSTIQNHEFGISVHDIETHPHLHRFFSVIATATDEKNNEYAAAIEGRMFPVYGVMWHPERCPSNGRCKIKKERPYAIAAKGAAFADFFISELRKCPHRPDTAPPRLRSVIEEHPCVQYPELREERCFFF